MGSPLAPCIRRRAAYHTSTRGRSMRPTSKLAALISGEQTPGTTDPEGLPFLWRDAHYVGVRSVQPGGRVSETLTARERDVLATLGRGFSNKYIARALQISPETVKSHVKRIFLKLAVRTRTQAALRAGTLGLLDIPEQCQEHTLPAARITSTGPRSSMSVSQA
jgi:DNA-binding NarL/FixJ family response regulator